jgi:ketosteroid isomerase-like protein
MKHPNAELLEKLYASFSKGDFASFLAQCPDGITFQAAGKSSLAGKYTKENFVSGFAEPMRELCGNSLKVEVHDVLASDRHGIALATYSLTKDGKQVQLRTAHVWRFENGKPVAWYEYSRDLYQFDAIFQ